MVMNQYISFIYSMRKKLLIGGVLVFLFIALASDKSATAPLTAVDGAAPSAIKSDGPMAEEESGTESVVSNGEGRINVPGWIDSPYVTPDGRALYFMYSRYNFFPIFSGGEPQLVTPDRPGHNNNDANPWSDSDIYVSYRQSNGSWGAPQNMSFNTTEVECCSMVVGSPAVMYYQTGYADTATDIVYREQRANGSWGKVVRLAQGVNSPVNEDNPHVSADQNHLWFTSQGRDGGVGGYDIWYSKKVDGEWQPAVNVGAPLNTDGDEDQIWIGEDGTTFFNREDGVYESHWDGQKFSLPTKVKIDAPGLHLAEVSIADGGKTMYFAGADATKQQIKIYSAPRRADGSWGPAVPID